MSPRRLAAALTILAVTGCADSSSVASGSTATGGGSGGGDGSGGATASGQGGAGTGAASGSSTGSSGPASTGTSGGGSSSSGDTTTSVTSGESCTVPGQCPPTGTACLIQACQAGICDPLLAAPGSPCADGGGTECNATGQCTAAACNNAVQDGDERGVDCGGGCPGCPVGTGCAVAADCATEACVGAVCVACGANGQPCCPGDTCTGAVDTCVDNTGQAWGGTSRECNCGVLREGQVLRTGDSRRSCDGQFRLVMQGDGNLVLYVEGGPALWSSDSFGTGSTYAVMQGDGNFVVYDATQQPHFDTGTQSPGAYLAIQGDGNLVVYSAGGVALWASNTVYP